MAKTKYRHRDDIKEEEFESIFRTFCNRCGFQKPDVEVRYSYGVYAGRFCVECAVAGYRDGCGLIDGKQGSASDLDEPLDED